MTNIAPAPHLTGSDAASQVPSYKGVQKMQTFIVCAYLQLRSLPLLGKSRGWTLRTGGCYAWSFCLVPV